MLLPGTARVGALPMLSANRRSSRPLRRPHAAQAQQRTGTDAAESSSARRRVLLALAPLVIKRCSLAA